MQQPFYFAGTNDLAINGRLGIGTTSYVNRFVVSDGVAIGQSYINSVAPPNGLIVVGNVGIGTNVPIQGLDVNGTIRATDLIGNGTQLTNIVDGWSSSISEYFENIFTGSTRARYTSAAITNIGNLYTWGNNYDGQLGNNNNGTESLIPINISSFGSLPGKTVVAVSCGTFHMVAIDSTGAVHTWGDNLDGQLGNNTTTYSPIPVNISTFGSLNGRTVVAVACGGSHTVALDSTGAVHTWGNNYDGQLGNNSQTDSLIPINISSFGSLSGRTIVAISCGLHVTAALDSTGVVHMWGDNSWGQLGNNTLGVDSFIPINISSFGSLSGRTIVAISCGDINIAALDSTGVVHTWGANFYGMLGNNTTVDSLIPINISSFGSLSGRTIIAISMSYHTAALDSTGAVHTWGFNLDGELGNNTTTDSLVPINISTYGSLLGIIVVAVACGPNHTVVLDSTGALHTWGGNQYGQLGNNTNYNSSVPINILSSFDIPIIYYNLGNVGIGNSFPTAKLYVEGSVLGSNVLVNTKFLGAAADSAAVPSFSWNGSTTNGMFRPATNTIALSTAGTEKIRVASNGYVGIGTTVPVSQLHVLGDVRATSFIGDGSQLTGNSQWSTSGSNIYYNTGNVGIGTNTPTQKLEVAGKMRISDSSTALPVLTLMNGQQKSYIVAGQLVTARGSGTIGSYHSLVISTNGQLYAWGWNFYGQLGIGNTTPQTTPINVSTFGTLSGKTVVAVACGQFHTVALDSTGAVHTWGQNLLYGQLGNNTTTNSLVPINVSTFGSLSGRTVVAVSCGVYYTVALDSTGAVHTWGQNSNGQLGNNTTTNSLVPINVSTFGTLSGKTVVAVVCGGYHTVALDSTGAIHTWGRNIEGQLGRGDTTTPQTTPINVSTFGTLSGKTVVAVSCGVFYTVALDSTGAIHTWGENLYGQLGRGDTTTPQTTPINVSTFGSLSGKTVVAVACGGNHTVALDSTGAIHTWGQNSYGQLGRGDTTTPQTTPINVSTFGTLSGKTVVAVAGGFAYTVALDSTGAIHTWGRNNYGQLGRGNTTDSPIPILTNVFIGANSALGIGINPSYQLQLSLDSAAKPATSTWTVTSDARLKADVQTADYNRCYEIVKGIDLRSYRWDSNIPGLLQSVGNDQHRLGWIAQEVEPLFPKAISTVPELYGLSNVLNVNFDQLYAAQYGAIKKLMDKLDNIEDKDIKQIESRINDLARSISTL